MPELSLLRKLSYCRKFRIWFKHAQKGQKPIAARLERAEAHSSTP